MDFFKIFTPIIYSILIVVWSYIFVFYLRKLFSVDKVTDQFFRLLIVILAIDAFRSFFESLYFGTWFSSLSGLLPITVYEILSEPEIVFIPKFINLIVSLLILFLIIRKWMPEESHRIEVFNKLLEEKTHDLKVSNTSLREETEISKQREEQYRKATINSPFPIMIYAEDGEVLMHSDSWLKNSGYNFDEINTIDKWTVKAYGKNSEILCEYIDKLYDVGSSIKEGEFILTTKGGEKKVWDFSSAPLEKLPDGRRLVISTAVDVTQRNKNELELIEKEKYNATLFENLNEGFAVHEVILNELNEVVDYIFLDINPAFSRLTGLEKENLIGKKVTEVIPGIENDPVNWIKRYGQIVKTGEDSSFEAYFSYVDKWLLIHAFKVKKNQFGITFSDITVEKNATLRLKESEMLLNATGTVAKIGGWSILLSSNELSWTQETYKIHELPLNSKINIQTAINFYHPEDIPVISAAVENAIKINKSFELELRIITAKNNLKWIAAKGVLYSQDNEPFKIMGTIQDISIRKNNENTLFNSEKKFRALVEQSLTGIYTFNKERFLYVNKQFCEMFGYSQNEIINKFKPTQLVVNEDGEITDENIEKRLSGEVDSVRYVIRGIRKDKKILWMEVHGTHLKLDGEDVIAGTVLDITERIHAENKIKNLNEELEEKVKIRTAELENKKNELSDSQNALLNIVDDLNQKSRLLIKSANKLENANKELESFTYSVSHDLKAPLRGIDGYSKLLKDNYAKHLDSEANIFIDNIRTGSLQMSQLIDDLLKYSRLERSSISFVDVDLKKLINQVVANYDDEIKLNNVEVIVNLENCIVKTDSNGFAMALRNLFENAIKFSKETEKPRIEIKLLQSDSNCQIYVIDNGVGFEMKYHDRIFEIFHRLHRVEDYPGTGIGLALVSKAMKRLGGSVRAESEIGEGASFILEINK